MRVLTYRTDFITLVTNVESTCKCHRLASQNFRVARIYVQHTNLGFFATFLALFPKGFGLLDPPIVAYEVPLAPNCMIPTNKSYPRPAFPLSKASITLCGNFLRFWEYTEGLNTSWKGALRLGTSRQNFK